MFSLQFNLQSQSYTCWLIVITLTHKNLLDLVWLNMQVLVFLGSKVANFGQEVLNPQVLICGCFRAVNPPRHQILRIDREGMIDR